MHKPGYDGWKILEKDNREKQAEKNFQTTFKRDLLARGVSESAIDNIKIEIEKSSLTISEEEARSGAFHTLSGGEPFYSLVLTGGSIDQKSFERDFLFYAVQGFKGASMTMSEPLEVRTDFRLELADAAMEFRSLTARIADHMGYKAQRGAAIKKTPKP